MHLQSDLGPGLRLVCPASSLPSPLDVYKAPVTSDLNSYLSTQTCPPTASPSPPTATPCFKVPRPKISTLPNRLHPPNQSANLSIPPYEYIQDLTNPDQDYYYHLGPSYHHIFPGYNRWPWPQLPQLNQETRVIASLGTEDHGRPS